MPTTGLRFLQFMVHGEDQIWLFLFTKNILNKKPIKVFNYGNHTRDFTYIDDIAKSVFNISKKFL